MKPNWRKPDGSLNWKLILIGPSWTRFIMNTILFIAIMFMAYGYHDTQKTLEDIQNNPCDYVVDITKACNYQQSIQNNPIYNSDSDINITIQNDTSKERGASASQTDS